MPGSPLRIVQCLYSYDPLNRSIGSAPHGVPNIQRFYRKDRLATEIQAAAKWSFFEYDHHVLAQRRQTVSTVDTTLLATDQQRSVLNALDATPLNRFAHSPYGFRPQGNGLLSLLGFNGERPDPVTGHYHLGNGYRQFNTVLMRFNSPDSWSPFGRGGLNGYAYCAGDPVNKADPTGHSFLPGLFNKLRKNSGTGQLSRDTKRSLKLAAREMIGENTNANQIQIEKFAQLQNKFPEDMVIEHAVKMERIYIDKAINSFQADLSMRTTERQVNRFRNSTLQTLQKRANVVSELKELGKQYLISSGNYHTNSALRHFDDFKRFDSKIAVEQRLASLRKTSFGAFPSHQSDFKLNFYVTNKTNEIRG
ncbi:MAG: repeat protein [Pseudomonas sp.]|nr:repeat protein [Pseudomonas sp.]